MENSKINQVILKILDSVRQKVEVRKERGLFFKPFWNRSIVDVYAYIGSRNFTLIAEVKRASPSAGTLIENFNPALLAGAYLKGGAGAISVITEEDHFKGSIEYLAAVRSSFPNAVLLRKDFVLDPVQVEEARAFGADFVLLIATFLEKHELKELLNFTEKLGLSALVEVHDEEDLEKALSASAKLIGINNRNLKTFEVRVDRCFELKKLVPPNLPVIAESGFSSKEEIRKLVKAGFKGVLIGTSLVKSNDPEHLVKTLLEGLDGGT